MRIKPKAARVHRAIGSPRLAWINKPTGYFILGALSAVAAGLAVEHYREWRESQGIARWALSELDINLARHKDNLSKVTTPLSNADDSNPFALTPFSTRGLVSYLERFGAELNGPDIQDRPLSYLLAELDAANSNMAAREEYRLHAPRTRVYLITMSGFDRTIADKLGGVKKSFDRAKPVLERVSIGAGSVSHLKMPSQAKVVGLIEVLLIISGWFWISGWLIRRFLSIHNKDFEPHGESVVRMLGFLERWGYLMAFWAGEPTIVAAYLGIKYGLQWWKWQDAEYRTGFELHLVGTILSLFSASLPVILIRLLFS